MKTAFAFHKGADNGTLKNKNPFWLYQDEIYLKKKGGKKCKVLRDTAQISWV